MRTDGKDPVFLLALTVTAFAVLGFIGISHVGRVSGPAELRPGFGSRSAQETSGARAGTSSHLQNFRKGSEVLKARAAAFASGLGFSFGGPSRPGRAASASAGDMDAWRSAPSSSAGGYDGDEKRDWGSMYYKGPRGLAPSGPGSWTASSGGASMTGSGAVQSEGMVPPGEIPDGTSPQGEEMTPADREAVLRYARQQASPAAAGQAASAMYAALPRSGTAAGGPSDQGSSSLPPIPPGRSGSISGMRGGAAAAADLNGAAESMSAGSGGTYGAQMAGGAADVAAKAAAVPVPSADSAKEVAGSGSSGGGGDGAGGSSSSSGTTSPKDASEKTKDASEKSKDKTVPTTQPKETPVQVASAHTPDIFQEIASEKLNGREERYLGDAPQQFKSAPGSPDPALQVLLRPRTVHPPAAASAEKRIGQDETPDPEDIEAVPVRRRESIKTEIHLFLRRLESGYGRMSDMQRTSCQADRELCREHELRGSYLT
ncbi:MAG TPA: hypothetical protein PK523_11760, partial [Elusimicrobiales bacterium]|nr:hypothetical protein [Elusimicrobiales bacterium]